MKKKLIEVALPLEPINKASAKEKSIRYGHPSTLHLWWSRKPLSTCRAVLFASLVDDPSSHPDQFPTEEDQERERQRLFRIIERLVPWENINNQAVLNEAKAEILKSTGGKPPAIYDPFCGGGSIPLEAQRLGLEAHGSDLNPVAVLITKALIEIPPKFADRAPINPESRKKGLKASAYHGASGLAEDIRYYGEWMRKNAQERIGDLYPPAKFPDGSEAMVIAWIWARTVRCPNPACGAEMPLVTKFSLSTKSGKNVWLEPLIDHAKREVHFEVVSGIPSAAQAALNKLGTGVANARGKRAKATFKCLVCDIGRADGAYIDDQAGSGRMGVMPLALACDGQSGRVFTAFPALHLLAHEKSMQLCEELENRLDLPREEARGTFASNAQGRIYGFRHFYQYFTSRQLLALLTYGELVHEARQRCVEDGASAFYADAIQTYLALGVSRLTDISNSLCRWEPSKTQVRNLFGRQAIPMIWEFAEANVFADAAGDLRTSIGNLCRALENCPAFGDGRALQLDARGMYANDASISTDPPYYNNVSYADLSDFFYVWLRRALNKTHPDLFSTLLVPKSQELVLSPQRFSGNLDAARQEFESGFESAFHKMRKIQNPDYPSTIYYAFKQTEEDEGEDDESSFTSTGWETMLEGLVGADFQITGTWPMRSELSNRPVASGTNALASSIVLVCRPRAQSAPLTTRKDFIGSLKRELGPAIRILQKENIPAVDLQQAAIGPGMAIFSRYKKVVESDGTPMRVRVALGLINQALDEVLSEQESDYDPETRWALAWFEQNLFNQGPFGDANTLANAKALSVEGMQNAGILSSRAGKVRLLKREELPEGWDPSTDTRITVWEVTQQLIHVLDTKGQDAARDLAVKVGGLAETARELAYRLYTLCERKGWAEEAGYYNSLVIAWPAIRSQEFALTGQD